MSRLIQNRDEKKEQEVIEILDDNDDLVVKHLSKQESKRDMSHLESKKNYRKKKIPEVIRNLVWRRDAHGSMDGFCYVCERKLMRENFHCGHIIPEVNGGNPTPDNLRAVCQSCNLSCGDMNMDEFKQQYFPHHEAKESKESKDSKEAKEVSEVKRISEVKEVKLLNIRRDILQKNDNKRQVSIDYRINEIINNSYIGLTRAEASELEKFNHDEKHDLLKIDSESTGNMFFKKLALLIKLSTTIANDNRKYLEWYKMFEEECDTTNVGAGTAIPVTLSGKYRSLVIRLVSSDESPGLVYSSRGIGLQHTNDGQVIDGNFRGEIGYHDYAQPSPVFYV